MKPDPIAALETAVPPRAGGRARGWTLAAALVLTAIVWTFGWYRDSAYSIVAIWERSETFAHGFLILPISAWMVWHRRHAVAALSPQPTLLAMPLLALVGFGWLLGELSGAVVVQQYGLVLTVPLLVCAILGHRVAWQLAFPLAFLLFAVPFGEFLLLPLMEHTADFVVFALRLTGIPVYREGLYFAVPSGTWSVVEACSGLRYLIASLTLGVLYAYLTYRSIARRAIFVGFSVVVPIVANWLRAYMIVMIGHLSDMKYAVGVDHLIYGWLFFGLVMLILFWIGSFWREDLDPQAAAPQSVSPQYGARPAPGALAVAAVAAVVVVSVWPVAAERLQGSGSQARPALLAPPQAAGWEPVAGRLTTWKPQYAPARAEVHQTYAKEESRAGLYVGYYRNQHGGAELITSGNKLVHSQNREWRSLGEANRMLSVGGLGLPFVEAKLRGPSADLHVWYWFWVDGQYTVNPYWAKLLQAKSMLLGRGDDAAVVIVYAPRGERPNAAGTLLLDFTNALLPAIGRSLEHARRARPAS